MITKLNFFVKNKTKKVKNGNFLPFGSPNFNIFYLMRLIARNYFKNYGAIFVDFILPIIIITILFNILPVDFLRTMVPGVIISPVISSSFISFSMAIFQWKKSVIYKKIQISQISIMQFFVAFLIFYFFTSFLSFLTAFVLTIIYDVAGFEGLKYFREDLKTVNLGLLVLGVILTILTAISLGILIAFLFNSFNAILAAGLGFFLVQAFVLGMYLSLEMVTEKSGMYQFSWFNPLYPGVRIFQLAWLENITFSLPENLPSSVLPNWFLVDDSQQVAILSEKFNQETDQTVFSDLIWELESYKVVKITNNQIILEKGSATFEEILNASGRNSYWQKRLTEMWTWFQSEELVWTRDPTLWKIHMIKDFNILETFNEAVPVNFVDYHEVHFHKSYWSFIPLFVGWFLLVNSLNFGISKYFR